MNYVCLKRKKIKPKKERSNLSKKGRTKVSKREKERNIINHMNKESEADMERYQKVSKYI